MKILRSLILFAVTAGAAFHASADSVSYSFTNAFAGGGAIPDGNTTGWFDTRTLSGLDNLLISDVDVSINISGGYSGDFYAYLTHGSGFSVLLNRVGRTGGNAFGYGDAGFSLTLNDSAANGDIHTYQTVPGYLTLIGNGSAWSPDGRNVNPLLALETDSRTRMLDQFNGLDPNGSWTLFIADVSGGGQGAVVSWGLNVTAAGPVPEPSSLFLIALGALMLLRKKFRA